MSRGRKLVFFVSCGTSRLCTTAGRLGTAMGTGTRPTMGAHTSTGGQCADAIIYTGVGAGGPARILHTGMGNRGLGPAKSEMGLPT